MLEFTGQANNNFDLVTKGDYEVVINMEWKRTKTGDNYINCAFKIRKDVDQPYGGRIVFDPIYKTKATGEFSPSKINGILSTIPNAKLTFENYDELIQYCNGMPMRITVESEAIDSDDPNSKMKNIVKFGSYMPTRFPLGENQEAVVEPQSTGESILDEVEKTEIDASDLPF